MKPIYCIGVMTGTSCDGADLAVLRITASRNGKVKETALHFGGARFPHPLRTRLRQAQAGKLSIVASALLTRDYSRWLAKLCDRLISRWKISRSKILIAVHGQTVWHAPESSISVQLLDPSIIASVTNCTVTAAFRQPDLARGGEGAPLVPFYHWVRCTTGEVAKLLPFSIHNVGGIANLTYVTKNESHVVAFDTGPGNALIDMATEKVTHGKLHFDKDGKIAASARSLIEWRKIWKLGALPFFRKAPPKSTGRELFNKEFLSRIPGSGAALVANATAFTAHSMAAAYSKFVLKSGRELNGVFIAGGGAQNPELIRLFSRELARLTGEEIPVSPLPKEIADPQFLEAMAFARLGFEAIRGNPVSLASVTGASENAIGAGIFPGKNYKTLLNALDLV